MTIQEILEAHQGTAAQFCAACPDYRPAPEELDACESVEDGLRMTQRHQAEVLDKQMQEREAEAVRETARNIERLYPRKGLINRADLLADIEIAADRLGRGIHANGRDKRPANGRQ